MSQNVADNHHCIVIGEGAIASKPYEFVISCRFVPLQGSTIMTEEEYEVIHRVVSRAGQNLMPQLEKGEG